MKTKRTPTTISLAALCLAAFLLALPARAANECQVYYQYKASNGSTQSITLDLDQGEVQPIGQGNVLYIQNKKSNPVNVEITNLWPPYGKKWMTLNDSGVQDPPSGPYSGAVTLYNVECGQSFVSPEQMVGTLKAAGVPVDEIAAQVAAAFNQTGEQLAGLLKAADYSAAQVAGALKEAFNASGQQAAQWMAQAGFWARHTAEGLKDAFNASGQQVAQWLQQAGYDASKTARGLIEAFNAGGQQAAQWLHEAGYAAAQVAGALKEQFNATAQQATQWLYAAGYEISEIAQALQAQFNVAAETFIELMQYEICGVAGCPGDLARQMIQALKDQFNETAAAVCQMLLDAGYAATFIAEGLKDVYNATGQQIAQWFRQGNVAAAQAAEALREAFNANAQQVTQWLQQAGYALADAALSLKRSFNASAELAVELLRNIYNASDEQLRAALAAAGYTAAQIAEALVGTLNLENVITGFTGGYHGLPIATPQQDFPLQPGLNRITLRGQGLIAVTSISGLPGDARATIVGRGGTQSARGLANGDFLHVEVNVPANVREGARGTALLMVGRVQGPRFNWIVQAPAPSGGNRGTPAPPPSRGGTARPDLAPSTFANNLYVVGSATTMDDAGNTYTALDPFNNSPFCQSVPQGGTARNNMPTANRQNITVPDVQWGVRNPSSVDINDAFVVRLLQGGREVASQTVSGLQAGDSRAFTFSRPQSTTCVARVGPGAGCYHCGLPREGWNDNAGFTVEVDTGSDVTEANENNNRATL